MKDVLHEVCFGIKDKNLPFGQKYEENDFDVENEIDEEYDILEDHFSIHIKKQIFENKITPGFTDSGKPKTNSEKDLEVIKSTIFELQHNVSDYLIENRLDEEYKDFIDFLISQVVINVRKLDVDKYRGINDPYDVLHHFLDEYKPIRLMKIEQENKERTRIFREERMKKRTYNFTGD